MQRFQFSTSHRFRRTFGARKSSVLGAVAILTLGAVACLGYWIMPDPTRQANDGDVALQKLPPLSSAWVLQLSNAPAAEKPSFLHIWLQGYELSHRIVPLAAPPIVSGGMITYLPFGKQELQQIALDAPERPIAKHRTYWLGTDRSGRDLLSRLILGARVSLTVGFGAVCISLFLGISFGTLGGYFGGKLDQVLMWLLTVAWSVPSLLLILVIQVLLPQKSLFTLLVALGLVFWIETARIVRNEVRQAKQLLFAEAARAMGFSHTRIVFRHILPNCIGPIIVVSSANFAAAVLTEAGLSFLGLGVQPPTPSWGSMLQEGFRLIGTPDAWHLIVFPSLAILWAVAGFHLTALGLTEAFQGNSRKAAALKG